MLKNDLELKILNHDNTYGGFSTFVSWIAPKNIQLHLLKDYLAELDIRAAQHVFYDDFITWVTANRKLDPKILFNTEFMNNYDDRTSLLFRLFRNADLRLTPIQLPQPSTPIAVAIKSPAPPIELNPVVDEIKSEASLDTNNTDQHLKAKSRLLALCRSPYTYKSNIRTIRLLNKNIIKDYAALEATICRLPAMQHQLNQAWKLCCLSGEPEAIKHAFLNDTNMAHSRITALRLALLSGKSDGIKTVSELLEITEEELQTHLAETLNTSISNTVRYDESTKELKAIQATLHESDTPSTETRALIHDFNKKHKDRPDMQLPFFLSATLPKHTLSDDVSIKVHVSAEGEVKAGIEVVNDDNVVNYLM